MKAISAFLCLLLCAGCGILESNYEKSIPFVRQVADELDKVPTGIAAANIPCVSSNYLNNRKQIAPLDVLKLLIVDPTAKPPSIYLYRIRPGGVILTLNESDYLVDLPVREGLDDKYNGQVTAFFDSSNNFLGYYAWSVYQALGDSQERFGKEMYSFTNSDMAKECRFEKTTRTMPTEVMKRLIRLPLSEHLAQ
jgi:hypothetical protein